MEWFPKDFGHLHLFIREVACWFSFLLFIDEILAFVSYALSLPPSLSLQSYIHGSSQAQFVAESHIILLLSILLAQADTE